jgi:hypothetical protein
MNSQFGLYPQFYVRKKNLLFPLMERYTGISMKGKTHGEAIQLYINLLNTNKAFRTDVDGLIAKQNFRGAIDPISAIAQGIGNIFSGIGNIGSSNAARDVAFAQTILAEQKAKATQTKLIIGGIILVSLSIIGLGIYLVVKQKGGKA